MTDFKDIAEKRAFFVLGPMRAREELPLVTIDMSDHAIMQMNLGVQSEDYNGLMERFSWTFQPEAMAPGGGDFAFSFQERN